MATDSRYETCVSKDSYPRGKTPFATSFAARTLSNLQFPCVRISLTWYKK